MTTVPTPMRPPMANPATAMPASMARRTVAVSRPVIRASENMTPSRAATPIDAATASAAPSIMTVVPAANTDQRTTMPSTWGRSGSSRLIQSPVTTGIRTVPTPSGARRAAATTTRASPTTMAVVPRGRPRRRWMPSWTANSGPLPTADATVRR